MPIIFDKKLCLVVYKLKIHWRFGQMGKIFSWISFKFVKKIRTFQDFLSFGFHILFPQFFIETDKKGTNWSVDSGLVSIWWSWQGLLKNSHLALRLLDLALVLIWLRILILISLTLRLAEQRICYIASCNGSDRDSDKNTNKLSEPKLFRHFIFLFINKSKP